MRKLYRPSSSHGHPTKMSQAQIPGFNMRVYQPHAKRVMSCTSQTSTSGGGYNFQQRIERYDMIYGCVKGGYYLWSWRQIGRLFGKWGTAQITVSGCRCNSTSVRVNGQHWSTSLTYCYPRLLSIVVRRSLWRYREDVHTSAGVKHRFVLR